MNSFGHRIIQWICFGIALLSVLGLGAFFLLVTRLAEQSVEVDRAKPRDSDSIAYVVTYILPFLTLTANTWQSRLALVLFVVMVGSLYIRSHIFYVNPLLSLFGYRLFEIEAGTGFVLLITRRKFIQPGRTVYGRRLSDYVFWERSSHGR